MASLSSLSVHLCWTVYVRLSSEATQTHDECLLSQMSHPEASKCSRCSSVHPCRPVLHHFSISCQLSTICHLEMELIAHQKRSYLPSSGVICVPGSRRFVCTVYLHINEFQNTISFTILAIFWLYNTLGLWGIWLLVSKEVSSYSELQLHQGQSRAD